MNTDNRPIAIVAGGCGLIGKAVVKKLVSNSYCVINVDPDCDTRYSREELLLLKAGIDDIPMLTHLLKQHSDISTFINCSYPSDPYQHLQAFERSTSIIAQHMSSNGGGSIVNLSSIYGVVGAKHSIYEGVGIDMPHTYSMIKGGIISLTRAIATAYGKFNVRANCVSPGGVYDNQYPKFIDRYNARVPLGRMATPEDIADPVVWLAGDEARYITGQNLIVDGGLTAW